MSKDIINIQLEDSVVSISCEHEKGSHVYILDEELVINDNWSIKKVIKQCDIGDYHENYEYIIKDSIGREKVKKYYYTGRSWHYKNECDLMPADNFSIGGVLSFFIRNSPIFKCKNWGEYEAYRYMYEIKKHTLHEYRLREHLYQIKTLVEKFFAEN